MGKNIEFTDRYQALGIPYPNVETMCEGQCEGTGVYPVHSSDETMTEAERAAWNDAEATSPADDGWHFIKCPDCDGTGLRNPPEEPNP